MSSGPDVHHSVAVSMYKFSGYHPSLMLHDHLLQIGSCKLLENPKCSPPPGNGQKLPNVWADGIVPPSRGTRSQAGEKGPCCMLMLTFLEQRALFSFYTCLITRELSSYTNFSHLSAKSVLQMHSAALSIIM